MTLRLALLNLPFVRETKGRTLEMWPAELVDDGLNSRKTGRAWAAQFLHVAREFDAPCVLHHIVEAMLARQASSQEVGFLDEISGAAISAPGGANPAVRVAAAALPCREGCGASSLPFFRVEEDGSANYWSVSPVARFEPDQSRGRHFAALAVQVLRSTGPSALLARIVASMRVSGQGDADADMRAAFWGTISSVAMSASPVSSVYQEAMLPIHRAGMLERSGVFG